MSYPSDQNLLRTLIEAAMGSNTETYTVPTSPYKHVLGANLSPAMPSGWPLKISGAAPISAPAAPTAGTPATTAAAGNFLTATGTYQWKLTSVTQFGETTPGAAFAPGALGAGVTGYNLAIPAVTEGTADAPVLYRRLYRTTSGGSTFYYVADIPISETSYLDGKPDADLDVAAPTTNTSGSQGAVSLTVNGVAGTEMPPGTTLSASGQYIVDYSLSNTAGTITHYSGDQGKTIVATYVAANLLAAALLNNIITAIKSIVAAFGTPGAANGTATLDLGGLLTPAEARPVHQVIVSGNSTNSPNLNATSWTTLPWTMTPGLSITTVGGRIRCRLSTANLGSGSAGITQSWQVIINGVTYPMGAVYFGTSGPYFGHSFVCETPALAAGTYAVTLQYQNSSGVNVAGAAAGIVVELEEII